MASVSLTLYKSELLYAVKNDTHIIAQGLFNNDVNPKAAYGIQVDNNPDIKKMMQSMQSGAQEVKTIIACFMATSSDTGASNAQLEMSDDDDAIVLDLNVSPRFNQAFIEPLTMHCHNYIVNRMLRDWFLATKREWAADYSTLMNEAKTNIQNSFFKVAPIAPDHSS